jgi:hypothetical protein
MTGNEKDYAGFLKDLAELSLKYGVSIGGCGCCGSPSLDDTDAKTGWYTAPYESDLTFYEGVNQ